jgi:hypothetical protein
MPDPTPADFSPPPRTGIETVDEHLDIVQFLAHLAVVNANHGRPMTVAEALRLVGAAAYIRGFLCQTVKRRD